MKFQVLYKGEWIALWHAHTAESTWEKLCALTWIGSVRMVDATGLVVREFHPATTR